MMYTSNKKNDNILSLLFPEFVITEETNPEESLGTIYPEEEVFIRNVVPKRKTDFIAGRICARKALARLGIDRFPIIMSNDRSPVWPSEIAGSISHTQGFCGVAVVLKKNVKSIGLDVECIDRLNDRCWHLVCTDSELSWIRSIPKERQKDIVSLTFSAKECFYKCQYAVNKCWVGFHDATISVDHNLNKGEYEIRLLKDISACFLKGTLFKGQYIFKDGFVFSGMTLQD